MATEKAELPEPGNRVGRMAKAWQQRRKNAQSLATEKEEWPKPGNREGRMDKAWQQRRQNGHRIGRKGHNLAVNRKGRIFRACSGNRIPHSI